MSNLSELLPAGAGAKSADFVASGTLGSGVTVALNSNGTVSAVAETSSTTSKGAESTFDSSAVNSFVSTTYDTTNNKIVAIWRTNSVGDYGYAAVGTVSGTSISWGTRVVFNSGVTSLGKIAYDENTGKVVIIFNSSITGTNIGYGIVGTVSGTSISFGSRNNFISGEYGTASIVYDTSASKCLLNFIDQSGSNYGKSTVVTVSGTSISFGTVTTFESSNLRSVSSAYSTAASKTAISYRDLGSSDQQAVVATVSGTSVSFGSPVQASPNYYTVSTAVYDPSADRVMFFGKAGDLGNSGRAVVGTISGTSISFGTDVQFEADIVNQLSAVYDSQAEKIVICYDNETDSRTGNAKAGTISGTSVTFDAPFVFNAGVTRPLGADFDPDTNQVIVAYQGSSDLGRATAISIGYTATNVSDFIGISDQAIANTATGAVIVQGGVSEKLSGLTVGVDYYVQDDGSLASGSIPFDISGASYDSVSFSAVSQMSNGLSEMAFGDSGNKLYIIRDGTGVVYQYNMTTAYDISTASYASKSYNAGAQDSFSSGLAFNNDGTKLYTLGRDVADAVYQHTLSTAWDVSTATYDSVSFNVGSQTGLPFGVIFNGDGTKMYITGFDNDSVYQYALSSAFDLSTASYASKSLSVSSQDGSPRSLALNADGTKLFINGADNDAVFQYNLSTPYDLATGSYSSISFSVSSQSTTPNALLFNDSGTKMFIGQAGLNSIVYQYSTTAASTTVPAGRALSTTSILLEG